jgi:hypothetical protein
MSENALRLRSTSRPAGRPALHVTGLALAACLALVAVGCGSRDAAPAPPEIDVALTPSAECFTAVAEALSTDEMEGRGIGTDGLARAAALISNQLDRLGLTRPAADGMQRFEATTGVTLGDGNELSVAGATLELSEQFVPLGFSSNGSFDGELVFAGFGIRAEELDYDDYDGLDVEGKVVLAMRFEPGEEDPDSPFEGRRPTRWSDLRYKAFTARERGAAALVLVDPPRTGETDAPDKLPALKSYGPVSRAGLPVFQVSRATADEWLAEAGTDLASVVSAIASDYRPRSMPLDGLRASGTSSVVPTTEEVANVVGALEGSGDLAGETVVIGAHYDHLGYGGEGSQRPGSEEIHNGADDNASGVAAMICGIAGAIETLRESGRPHRAVTVAAFAAEEIGLGGSGWFSDNPPMHPMEDTVAMVNLDMVGRMRDDKLMALGSESADEWEEILTAAAGGLEVELGFGGDGYGPSDHTSFFTKDVPVVHFFTGSHDEYHTPDDDAPLLNAEGWAKVSNVVARLIPALATRDARLTLNKSPGGAMMAGDSRGYGAYLGTVPDYSSMQSTEGGVLLADVRAGGPADLAGVRGGDTLVELAGIRIENLYDMTFALREHKPGQTVDLVVLRDGERVELRATLGDRAKRPVDLEGGHGQAAGGTHG